VSEASRSSRAGDWAVLECFSMPSGEISVLAVLLGSTFLDWNVDRRGLNLRELFGNPFGIETIVIDSHIIEHMK
jgi:hypothetical protein